ncbi:hypothetical protein N8I77_003242 [Diaporthe amygdali]|uniref:YggU-like protein n=1 Tax=Phomopsis amygdali TaxID=1214568 RepID=A0AAD9SJD2_PHOAM|nr:hypothetical protein N8I77_003242 [Diaporthe amygdali]
MNLKLWGESTQRFQKLSGTGPTFFTLHIHMASHRVLQYVAGAKTKPPTVYMRCHVKPGASKVREGITALTDSTIELCVSAVPKDGESNKAVLTVLSEALNVPKSDLQITRGAKSRDKIIALGGKAVQDSETECISRIMKQLDDAIEANGS